MNVGRTPADWIGGVVGKMSQSNVQEAARTSVNFDEPGDNDDLQALFDSLTAGGVEPVVIPVAAGADASGDNDDLQALFDSVSGQVGAGGIAPVPPAFPQDTLASSRDAAAAQQVFNQIGVMTRELHNTLRELGYERLLQDTARATPDARQRLDYIVKMTEQAASRVPGATEVAKPIQHALRDRSQGLAGRWDKVFANQLSSTEFKSLAAETHAFLHAVPQQVAATDAQLTEIMMAQDFQDLTGQVIKKIVDLAQEMEQKLLTILIDVMPPEVRAETPEGLLNGPVVNAAGRTDIVQNQGQVDELLESLGF